MVLGVARWPEGLDIMGWTKLSNVEMVFGIITVELCASSRWMFMLCPAAPQMAC